MRYADTGDGGTIRPFYWQYRNMRNAAVERELSFAVASMRFKHRSVREPLPDLPGNPAGLRARSERIRRAGAARQGPLSAASIALGQEVADQAREARGLLDLGPVPAAAEDMELRARDERGETP